MGCGRGEGGGCLRPLLSAGPKPPQRLPGLSVQRLLWERMPKRKRRRRAGPRTAPSGSGSQAVCPALPGQRDPQAACPRGVADPPLSARPWKQAAGRACRGACFEVLGTEQRLRSRTHSVDTPHIPTARPWLGRLTVGTQFPFSENLKGRSEDLV